MKKIIFILACVMLIINTTGKCFSVENSGILLNVFIPVKTAPVVSNPVSSCPDSLINISDTNICIGDTVMILAGIINNRSSLDFGGYLKISDTTLQFFSESGVSFAFWVKNNWDTVSGTPSAVKEYLFDWMDVTGTGAQANTRYMMALTNDGYLNWLCEGDSLNGLGNMNYHIASQNQYDNQWIFLTGTINTDSSCLYVNGTLVSTAYYSIPASSFSLYGGGDKGIGGGGGIFGYNTNALMDEFQVWTKALSQAEIQQYMAYLPSGNEANLLAYWDFNENTGDTAYDKTANNYKGILYNVAWSNDVPVPTVNSYTWSTGDTTNTIMVSPLQATTYFVTVSDGITSCTDSVNVSPNPIVVFDPLPSICLGTPPLILSGGSPAGGFYSGPGVSNGVFNPLFAGTGTHIITYTYSDINSCTGSATQAILVYPVPSVNFSPLSNVCLDVPPFTLSGGTPAGGYYTGPGVSTGMFNPIFAGTGTHIVTYYYTDTNGCTNSATQAISVYTLPAITFTPMPDVCIDDAPFTLSAATPSGGTYSGNGVSSGMFDPQAAGTGTHILTYTYTNVHGCINKATQSVNVNPLPVVNLVLPANICQNAAALQLSGGSPPGGSYSGTGVYSGFFHPATAGLGNHQVTYHYIDNKGCENSATKTITVNPVPATGPVIGPDKVLQYDTALYSVSLTVGSTYHWMITNGSILSGQTTNSVWVYWGAYGSGKISVTETNQWGCIGDTNTLNVIIGNAGLTETDFSSAIIIYPNPSQGLFVIYISNAHCRQISWQIHDQTGRMLFRQDNEIIDKTSFFKEISLENLPDGIYFLRLILDEQVVTKKMVINTR